MPNEVLIGIIAGVFTSIALIPQVLKIIKEKKADNISVGTVISFIIGHSIWVYYGICKEELPIILTNVFALTVDVITIILKWVFRKNSK